MQKLTYKTYLDLWCLKHTNYQEFLKQYENVKRSLNEFHESDHPRDEEGKFSDKEEETSLSKEIQDKINSVQIDFSKDNVLPELNKKELETFKSFGIDVKGKKVLFKKFTLDRNKERHPDLQPEDYNKIVGACLYNPEEIFKANDTKPYFHMITRLDKDNGVVLLDLNLSKDNLEIVHVHILRDKSKELLKRKNIE